MFLNRETPVYIDPLVERTCMTNHLHAVFVVESPIMCQMHVPVWALGYPPAPSVARTLQTLTAAPAAPGMPLNARRFGEVMLTVVGMRRPIMTLGTDVSPLGDCIQFAQT